MRRLRRITNLPVALRITLVAIVIVFATAVIADTATALRLKKTYLTESGNLEDLPEGGVLSALGPIAVNCPGAAQTCTFEITAFGNVYGTSPEVSRWGFIAALDGRTIQKGMGVGWSSVNAQPDGRTWVVWFDGVGVGTHDIELLAFKEGGAAQLGQRNMIVRVYKP